MGVAFLDPPKDQLEILDSWLVERRQAVVCPDASEATVSDRGGPNSSYSCTVARRTI
jgi:hypothetical protein